MIEILTGKPRTCVTVFNRMARPVNPPEIMFPGRMNIFTATALIPADTSIAMTEMTLYTFIFLLNLSILLFHQFHHPFFHALHENQYFGPDDGNPFHRNIAQLLAKRKIQLLGNL